MKPPTTQQILSKVSESDRRLLAKRERRFIFIPFVIWAAAILIDLIIFTINRFDYINYLINITPNTAQSRSYMTISGAVIFTLIVVPLFSIYRCITFRLHLTKRVAGFLFEQKTIGLIAYEKLVSLITRRIMRVILALLVVILLLVVVIIANYVGIR